MLYEVITIRRNNRDAQGLQPFLKSSLKETQQIVLTDDGSLFIRCYPGQAVTILETLKLSGHHR